MDLNQIKTLIKRTNDQRVKMALTLMNVMKHTEHSSLSLRSSVAAAMMEMLNTSMIEEDKELINMLNEGIDDVCNQAKEQGVDDLRYQLQKTIDYANKVLDERMSRVKDADEILSQLNLNDINLN